MTKQKITSVILAAGKGTRMKSAKAKVLHEVFYRPMIHHVLDAAMAAGIDHHAVIIGHQRQRVQAVLEKYEITPVVQEEQLGTGHAVLCAEEACRDGDLVMILCGDTPLIRPETLRDMIAAHLDHAAAVTLMTTTLDNPFGYGRILSDDQDLVSAIVEEKDATDQQRAIREINAGIYLAETSFLFDALKQVGNNNSQGEVYLTDIVAIAGRQGRTVRKFVHPEAMDVLGVNSRVELALAHHELQMRRNRELMLSGVTIYSPESVSVAPGIDIGRDTIIHPGVHITGSSQVGNECVLGPGCLLDNCRMGDKVVAGGLSVLHNCTIEDQRRITPQTMLLG